MVLIRPNRKLNDSMIAKLFEKDELFLLMGEEQVSRSW